MLTYLLLSNGTQASGDHSCPVQRCFEEFTSHQLDLGRPMVHANLALKSGQSALVTPGHLSAGAYYTSNPESQHTCFTSSPYSSAAATPTEWQPVPATQVTLLLPGKECEKRQEVSKVHHELASQFKPLYANQKRTRRTH